MTQAVSLAQLGGADSPPAFRNRIINGAMVIDQRNAGAAYTNSNQSLYGLDRWRSYGITSAVLTVQQSTTAPAGFSNSQSVTVTTSTTANDTGGLSQIIEGNNAFDFGWGTSSGVAVTASFMVRASVIGTYNIYLRYLGSTATYYYVATYTVNVANTWEQKTVNIPAPPVGAGAFTAALNSSYLEFRHVINSSGNTTTVAANTWSTTNAVKTTGSVDLASIAGATFYITGVQLEKGSTATSFDYRPYGTELALCQRYFQKYQNVSGGETTGSLATGTVWTTTGFFVAIPYITPMRALPTGSYSGVTAITLLVNSAAKQSGSISIQQFSTVAFEIFATSTGMTSGQAGFVRFTASTDFVALSAEL